MVWEVMVVTETTLTYGPGGTAADLAAASTAAGKSEAEARRQTMCQVFSTDPVDVQGYMQLGETVIPVKN